MLVDRVGDAGADEDVLLSMKKGVTASA